MNRQATEREEAQRDLQCKLAEMNRIAAEICEIGLRAGVDCVDFLGHQIRFAIDGEPAHDRSARITAKEWSSSSFGCYPSDEDWEWFHGPNPPPKPWDFDY